MKYSDLITTLTSWVIMYSGISGDDNVVTDFPLLRIIPTASRTDAQQALWLQINSKIIDLAQNGPRPSTPYLSTHLQLLKRQGSTPYKSEPILNISKLASMSSTFITGNIIAIIINDIVLNPITFNIDNATTYGLINDAIQVLFPEATVTIDPINFKVQIYQAGVNFTMSLSISGGASQPSVVISSPYSKIDTTIFFVNKANLYLQGYGYGSQNFLENLQQSLYKDEVREFLKDQGISYLMDNGIQNIHTLVDLTYEERFSFDLVFLVNQVITDVTYDIDSVDITKI